MSETVRRYTEYIGSASYGEEVRGSIVKAINALDDTTDRHGSSIKGLIDSVGQNTADISDLRDRTSAVENMSEINKRNITGIQSITERNENDISDLKEKTDSNVEGINEVKNESSKLKSSVDENSASISELNKKVNSHSNDISNLEKKSEANAKAIENIQKAEGVQIDFIPVQQGGGKGQKSNKIYIGWTDKELKAQVDQTDMGSFVMTGSGDSAILPISKGGTGKKTASDAERAIMPISTVSLSEFGSVRSNNNCTGYRIRLYGSVVRATLFFEDLTSGSDCKCQMFTINSKYRPSGSHVGMVNAMTFNGHTYSRGMGFINAGENDGIITIILPTASTVYQTVEVYIDYIID